MRAIRLLLIGAAALPVLASSLVVNVTSLPPYQVGGAYVGLLTANGGGQTFQAVCNDYSSTTYVPTSIQMEATTLSDLLHVRFASLPDALVTYQRAALLLTHLNESKNSSSETGAYQWAIWKLFQPNITINSPTLLASVEAKLSQSSAEVLQPHDYSQIKVYTPGRVGVDGRNHDSRGGINSANQEFLSGSASPVTATPEPASLGLVGVVLLMGGWLGRRCRSARHPR
jgi:hypothetical protein